MTLLLAIIAAAGLVWAAALVIRGSLMAGCLTFLLVNSCLGYYFFHARIGPAELAADRLVLILLSGAYFIHRLAGKTDPKPLTGADYLTFAFLGWLVTRTFTSDWQHVANGAPAPMWHLIVGYLSPLWIFWIARQSRLNRGAIRLLHGCLIGFGVYLGATAILEITHQWWAVFPRHIADPEVGLHFGRARGPMVQSIVFGFCLSICTFCVWTSRRFVMPKHPALLLLAIPLMLAGIYFSYTRCIWIGAAAGLGVLAYLTFSYRVRLVVMGGAMAVALLVATFAWDSLVSFDGGRSADATRDSTSMRASFTYVSYKMLLDHPVVGCGFGQYLSAKDAYLADRSTSMQLDHIREQLHHITPLSIMVETGLVGLGLYLAMLVGWARAAWKLWQATEAPEWIRAHGLLMLATLMAYFASALFQPVGHMNIVHMVMFFLAGTSIGLTSAVVANPQTSSVLATPRKPLWKRNHALVGEAA